MREILCEKYFSYSLLRLCEKYLVVTEYFIKIRDIAHKTFDGYATVHVTGMPVIIATVNEAMNADLKLLIPVVI
ncbi:hypothetical protein, partial [Treponema sp. R8-4-B8]